MERIGDSLYLREDAYPQKDVLIDLIKHKGRCSGIDNIICSNCAICINYQNRVQKIIGHVSTDEVIYFVAIEVYAELYNIEDLVEVLM